MGSHPVTQLQFTTSKVFSFGFDSEGFAYCQLKTRMEHAEITVCVPSAASSELYILEYQRQRP